MNDFLFVLPLQEAFNLGSYFGFWTSDDYLSDIKLLLPNFVVVSRLLFSLFFAT